LSGREHPPFEKEYIRKDGSRVPVLVGAVSFEDRSDEGVAFIVDLTERKQMESFFRQSEKMAAVGELAAGVAHELNNPLSAILGFSELMLSAQDLNEQQRQDLQTIHKQSQRCRTIIQNLLQFSRPKVAKKEVLQVMPVLESALELVRYDFVTSSVELTADYAEDLPLIYGDRGDLQQVFINLLTNARHAMEGRRPARLNVKVISEGRKVHIKVADTGVGISKDHLRRIFDPFFTTKPPGKGTGLGLSICTTIMEQHHGALKVESTVGVGTTFTMELPVHDAVKDPPGRLAVPKEPARSAGRRQG
jgi:two-component system NtrC family sensor kinase